MREVVFSMYKSEEIIFKKKTRIFIRDLVDHITHINENIEQSKDRVNGLMSIYLSGTNEIMNNIMKTLTIVSTIFMALSLIAGIYGMNFKYMPETEWRYGYFIVVSAMFILAVILFVFFRRRKWL
jgi:magnesium transporter